MAIDIHREREPLLHEQRAFRRVLERDEVADRFDSRGHVALARMPASSRPALFLVFLAARAKITAFTASFGADAPSDLP
ncbi:hypothetical protein ACFPTO_15840 [Paraburkholderia denitrificans]|uniref:Uncharacterized protein n=1 Tax=Paraburkholderia denitrificans TaxID=694025 RepID=A0ABW0JAX7_9BURK